MSERRRPDLVSCLARYGVATRSRDTHVMTRLRTSTERPSPSRQGGSPECELSSQQSKRTSAVDLAVHHRSLIQARREFRGLDLCASCDDGCPGSGVAGHVLDGGFVVVHDGYTRDDVEPVPGEAGRDRPFFFFFFFFFFIRTAILRIKLFTRTQLGDSIKSDLGGSRRSCWCVRSPSTRSPRRRRGR